MFRPLEASKSESQYFFTEKTNEMLIKMLRFVGTTHVICLGAPTVHEMISCNVPDMSSVLLDIDQRYVSCWISVISFIFEYRLFNIWFCFQLQFYECDRFRWFNMYNCHVLEECDTNFVLESVLIQSDSTAVFIDPPFGGRLEPLAYTLNKFDQIRQKCNKSTLSSKNTFFLLFFVFEM